LFVGRVASASERIETRRQNCFLAEAGRRAIVLPDRSHSFCAAPVLDLFLPGECCPDVLVLLAPDQLDGPAMARVRRSFTGLVLADTKPEVSGAPYVVGAVGAAQHVGVGHAGDPEAC
jgi:hypothetical protein